MTNTYHYGNINDVEIKTLNPILDLTVIELLEYLNFFRYHREYSTADKIRDGLLTKGFQVRVGGNYMNVLRNGSVTYFDVEGQHLKYDRSYGNDVLNELLTKWRDIK